MYPREVRELAVGLHFDDGAGVREVARLLGQDGVGVSASAVMAWVRADPRYRPSGRRMPRASYTLEEKLRAVSMLRGAGDAAAAAASVGCSVSSVRRWARIHGREGGAALADMQRGASSRQTGPDPLVEGSREAELRRQVYELRLQNAVMRETIRVLKAADPRCDPRGLTNGERTRVVDAIRDEFGLAAALGAVGLGRSTYYYQRAVAAAGDKYAVLRGRIRVLFEDGGRVWGYRVIHRLLRQDGADPIAVSEKVVRRIMREEGLRPIYLRRPRRWSSYRGELSQAPPNLVKRDFHAGRPNTLWITDVTQFALDGYKCWLSPVIDCFDGMVVSWTLSRSPDAAMANRMLLDACSTLGRGERPVIHSDRGCHYRWPGWIRICEKHGLTRSMSAKGRSPDNAAAEGFFGRLKNEFFHCRDWRGVGYDEFRKRLAAYLAHYNETRIKKSLGWKSPVQYRRSLGLAA